MYGYFSFLSVLLRLRVRLLVLTRSLLLLITLSGYTVSNEIDLEKVKIEEFGFEKEPTDINPTISIQKISKVNRPNRVLLTINTSWVSFRSS